jgi:pyruvate,orthophosphate dikinase
MHKAKMWCWHADTGAGNQYSMNDKVNNLPSLEKLMPQLYKELFSYQKRLELHYKDMQDIEFTIEKGTLYMLQCRVGKRNGVAAVRMATEMFKEKLIDAKQPSCGWLQTNW